MIHEKLNRKQVLHELNALSWKKSLKDVFKSYRHLAEYLQLPEHFCGADKSPDFPLRVPLSFAKRMEKGNVRDPLLLQVLPLLQERMASVDYVSDPLLEKEFVKAPGLLHKYGNRVLLIAHPACAIHCRYCFRREFDYQAHTQSRLQWQNAFEYIQAHHDIEEAILSGGDPLMHNDAMLLYFIGKFNDMKHLKRLRIHSRILSILPERINQPLTQIFAQSKLQKILVTHINHVNEINDEVIASMQLFRQNDFALLNQSTLFKGVNDDVQVLKKLSEGLFLAGVAPYYLHVLDKVKGAGHFDVSKDKAIAIHERLKAITSGYLVPKLVKECAHEKSKTWLLRGQGLRGK